ncbi:hypothetical protein AHF37_08651 [Paragonimus kellicotti]|nr:hypothetical protein AHF37_08651 [Paragonimus kellicotti]
MKLLSNKPSYETQDFFLNSYMLCGYMFFRPYTKNVLGTEIHLIPPIHFCRTKSRLSTLRLQGGSLRRVEPFVRNFRTSIASSSLAYNRCRNLTSGLFCSLAKQT